MGNAIQAPHCIWAGQGARLWRRRAVLKLIETNHLGETKVQLLNDATQAAAAAAEVAARVAASKPETRQAS
jgi:hypothetical protein